MPIILEGFFAVLSNILLFTSAVESNNSFPHPLSPEKEKEYLTRYRDGDKAARDVLIRHNLRLVAFIANKYTNYPDKDELISVGTLGLIKAINTYDVNKAAALATYASRCIENEILMLMRSYKKMQNNVSLYENVGSDKEGNDIALIDMLSVGEETVYAKLEEEMIRETLERLMDATLNARERTILNSRYGLKGINPMTQQEVADTLGISRSYVSRIEKAILEKLKKAILKEKIEL